MLGGIAFLLFALVALAVSFVFGKQVKQSRLDQCWSYQVRVENLAQSYVTQQGGSSFPAYVEDIPGFDEIGAECPSGGKYTWDPVSGRYVCSEHGPHPDGYAAPQSTVEGTNTVTHVEEKQSTGMAVGGM